MAKNSEILEISHRFALLIGVRDYADPKFRKIPQTIYDVKALEKVLKKFDYTVRTLHCDQSETVKKPTKDNIWGELKNIANQTGEGDLLLVHFGGHGVLEKDNTAYLLPVNGRKTSLRQTAIDLEEFKQEIVKAEAQAKILILDACHSGIDKDRDAEGMSAEFERHVFLKAKGTATLASCRRGEVAYEHDKKKHGAFTHFLLEGLKGAEPRKSQRFITFDDLKDYVTNGVRSWAIERGLQQWPNASTQLVGDPALVELIQQPPPQIPSEIISPPPPHTHTTKKTIRNKLPWKILIPLIVLAAIIFIVIYLSLLNKKVTEIKKLPEVNKVSESIQIHEIHMVHIPEGRFLRGTSPSESQELVNDHQDWIIEWFKDEIPQREIYLDSFYISKYEITNTQYKRFLEDNPNYEKPAYWDTDGFNDPDQPVVGVSWYDADAFCKWLSKKKGENYRLPTEAEWEKAARGTDGRTFPWGNEWPDTKIVNIGKPYGKPMPVGHYPQGINQNYGTMEMIGNVAEWCNDWYDENYYSNIINPHNPMGTLSGQKKVVRGGSFNDNNYFGLRCAARYMYPPDTKKEFVGFRIVRISKNQNI